MVDFTLPNIDIPGSTIGDGVSGPRNPIDSNAQSNYPNNLVSAEVSLGGTIPEDTTIKEGSP